MPKRTRPIRTPRLDTVSAAISAQAEGAMASPASVAPSRMASLPMKPAKGGMPASSRPQSRNAAEASATAEGITGPVSSRSGSS